MMLSPMKHSGSSSSDGGSAHIRQTIRPILTARQYEYPRNPKALGSPQPKQESTDDE